MLGHLTLYFRSTIESQNNMFKAPIMKRKRKEGRYTMSVIHIYFCKVRMDESIAVDALQMWKELCYNI